MAVVAGVQQKPAADIAGNRPAQVQVVKFYRQLQHQGRINAQVDPAGADNGHFHSGDGSGHHIDLNRVTIAAGGKINGAAG